jgi:hypothetical protein
MYSSGISRQQIFIKIKYIQKIVIKNSKETGNNKFQNEWKMRKLLFAYLVSLSSL